MLDLTFILFIFSLFVLLLTGIICFEALQYYKEAERYHQEMMHHAKEAQQRWRSATDAYSDAIEERNKADELLRCTERFWQNERLN